MNEVSMPWDLAAPVVRFCTVPPSFLSDNTAASDVALYSGGTIQLIKFIVSGPLLPINGAGYAVTPDDGAAVLTMESAALDPLLFGNDPGFSVPLDGSGVETDWEPPSRLFQYSPRLRYRPCNRRVVCIHPLDFAQRKPFSYRSNPFKYRLH